MYHNYSAKFEGCKFCGFCDFFEDSRKSIYCSKIKFAK